MDLKTIHVNIGEAYVKWRQYVKICKTSKDPMDKDMREIYNQAKRGNKIIDIHDVIRAGGARTVTTDGSNKRVPNLAITSVMSKRVYCKYHNNGTVDFNAFWYNTTNRYRIDLKQCLEPYKFQDGTNGYCSCEAPVPKIPSTVWQGKLTIAHYILWEVDAWENVVSTDPVLLKRITKNLFVVLAHWDLTPLEAAVMKQYL